MIGYLERLSGGFEKGKEFLYNILTSVRTRRGIKK